jgi:hypothetical protein
VRRLAALLVAAGLVAAALALLLGAGPAMAHNVLIASDPPDGASLPTGPRQVTLTFDLPVQPGFSTVAVTGPDGNQWQAAGPAEHGAVVAVPLRPLGPAGQYTIGYQVLSADSHPVRGTVRFILTTADTGTPAPPPPATGFGAAPAGPPTENDSDGPPAWPWLAGAGVLLVAGIVVALRVGRAD